MTTQTLAGRVWKFGDNINTDLMMPGWARNKSDAEQAKAVFSANRPGWSDLVLKGDVLIAGSNFGTGSSRVVAKPLRDLGIACVIAESINGLCMRSSVASGFTVLRCPGILAAFEEGQTAEISTDDWTVRNRETGKSLNLIPVPDSLLKLMQGPGLYAMLRQQGAIGDKYGERKKA